MKRESSKKDEYGLTLQQRIYADAFVLTGNKRASAIKAGAKPASASKIAARLSTNVTIQKYVDMRRHSSAVILENDYGITRGRVLRELAAVAFLDPARLYDDNGNLLPVHKMNEITRRAIAAVDVNEVVDSDGALVGYTKKIKMTPKIAALELLGRYLRMWNDKDGGQGSILNIVIHSDKNLLDNPPSAKDDQSGFPIKPCKKLWADSDE